MKQPLGSDTARPAVPVEHAMVVGEGRQLAQPLTRSIPATVRRPGARTAPATRVSAWHQVGCVRSAMNGRSQVARGSGR
jgi:hypothetical protein